MQPSLEILSEAKNLSSLMNYLKSSCSVLPSASHQPKWSSPHRQPPFFIMAFASGIFIPLAQLPDVLQNIAPYSPFYRLGQIAWNAVGVQTGSTSEAIWLLVFYTIVFFALAVLAYRKEEQNSFG